MTDCVIRFKNITKKYQLGVIGGGTLQQAWQSWWARKQHREDPNSRIGSYAGRLPGDAEFLALDNISFDVFRGETLGIIGANGAGKSTALKLLSRVTAPTSGDIWIKGRVASLLEVGTGFHAELTGRENIYLNGAILGMNRSEISKKIDSIIEFSECAQFIDTPVKRYSSGMYVKLAFAVAANLDCEIMVMDEILAVGDLRFQKKCLGKMSDAALQEGRTVIYVSHNMSTIRQLCNRCLVFDHGKIVFDGDVDSAVNRYMECSEVLASHYDLSERKRSRYLSQRAYMRSVQIIPRANTAMDKKQIIEFILHWNAVIDLKEICLRIVLQYLDYTAVGMCLSASDLNAEAGGVYHTTFALDVSCLAAGRYYADLSLCSFKNAGGRFDVYDHVQQAFVFETENQNSMLHAVNWRHNRWGHCILPLIEIIK